MLFSSMGRLAGIAIAVAAAAALVPSVSQAQGRFESRSRIGAFIPTGDHRQELDNALMMGSAAGFRLSQNLSVVGSVVWSTSNAKAIAGQPEVKVYSYDVGAEYRVADVGLGREWQLRPFVGGGVGGRTYDSDIAGASTDTDLAGYGALGIQADYKKVGFRIEARDYVSRYNGLQGEGESTTRNDVGLTAGIAFRLF